MNLQGRSRNDLWSAFRYGDQVKVVYYKHGSMEPPKEGKFKGPGVGENERVAASVKRAKAAVFELAACNPFEHFVTLTLDERKRDRFDLDAFRKAFAQFVRDLNKKRGTPVRYLLIPEQHKDGAWHMHGLIMGLTSADLCKNRNGYLDWPGYAKRFGFISLAPIRSQHRVCAYVTKYVTKTFKVDKGGEGPAIAAGHHLYFASQGLERRETLVKYGGGRPPTDKWDFENEHVKIAWLPWGPQESVDNLGKG